MYLVLLLKITYGVTLMCLVLPSDIIVNRPGVLSVNSLLRQEVDLHVTIINAPFLVYLVQNVPDSQKQSPVKLVIMWFASAE
jgi:hypothetical protein